MTDHSTTTAQQIALADAVTAHNYHPLPIVASQGSGSWIVDVEGRRHLDCLAAYSALNFGHGHPELVRVAKAQIDRMTLTSRAFHNDQLGAFCRDLAALAGMDRVLPMNTGAEAVETAIKVARRWGTDVRGIAEGEIIVASDNFHGRTTTIVSFSTDEDARRGFGPFTPGFVVVPYGDAAALAEAITDRTVAVLLEPVQGEAGVVIPPPGYLAEVRRLCTARSVLFIADEIQSGLGRCGATFACEVEGVVPDVYLLGKALGGGIVPVSAVVSRDDVLGVITPGSHGSTFGGNPLAAAVGRAVVGLLATGEFQARAKVLGEQLRSRLEGLVGHGVQAVRTRGLWAGIDIDPALMTGRRAAEELAARGVLSKETHGQTLRLAPPLVITEQELDWMVDVLTSVLAGEPGPALPTSANAQAQQTEKAQQTEPAR
ncbi:ornithine--oxo-acid transaminase [Propionibacteriaceae bacterium Y1685]|uniref:ornithine--oxo-acid transaminase n=1 Tax=Microlunatus sp. Y1700 TaxID=3418487 RepID=UPI003B782A9B